MNHRLCKNVSDHKWSSYHELVSGKILLKEMEILSPMEFDGVNVPLAKGDSENELSELLIE